MKRDRLVVTRRGFCQTAIALGLGPAPGEARGSLPQADARTSPAGLNRFPRMVQEYFTERVRAAEREASARKAALKTRADAEAYLRQIRARIATCFGPMPDRTPLNPQVRGVVER